MTAVEKKPNVFIAWSGERSRLVATHLVRWIPEVIDAVRPWMSDENIRSGANWFSDIMSAVGSIDIGILCLTEYNLRAPWIHFEAGALAKKISNDARVIPYFIGTESAELKPPLSAFQGRGAERAPTLRLMHDINEATGLTADRASVDKRFNAFWSDLEGKIKEALAVVDHDATKKDPRKSDDLIREMLNLIRGIRADLPRSSS